ncbi:MAG: bis(5'-nucleosyl)-tetraphosphatase (symmetrical) YqeK [Candidatus Goldbacteria bacterium]|nr:bis(5'-nucleosyl)-tetraphosphatase (symmetrical) YqeK [Candidatus Goldiibacteriota bacterium]
MAKSYVPPALRAAVKKHLNKYSYKHAIGAEKIGVKLAIRFGENPEKAALACLLHDCAKDMDHEEQHSYMKLHGIKRDIKYPRLSALFHSRTGAHMAQYSFGITDKDVLAAIANHTVGKKGMTGLQKIVYVSDFIETGRRYIGSKKLRERFLKDKNISLDELVMEVVKEKMNYLISSGHLIHVNAVSLWNELVEKKNKVLTGNKRL